MLQLHENSWTKSNVGSKFNSLDVRGGLKLWTVDNLEINHLSASMDPGLVQFYFCLEGNVSFSFPNTSYKMPLIKEESCFLYYPEDVFRPVIDSQGKATVVALFSTLEDMHKVIMGNDVELNFLSNINTDKKYYRKDPIRADLELVLRQLVGHKNSGSTAEIFLFGKVLEAFSLYFSQDEDMDAACPYLNNESSLQKIKQAKELLISKMGDPPTISQLAEEVGIKEFRLKEGFKSVYGTTLFAFLLDYKMHKAKIMLDSQRYKIQEVAVELGYNSASHFISAFKKKYGLTPKQYLLKK